MVRRSTRLRRSTDNKSGYAKASWFFGWTFAGAGCTIVSGAIAERATFMAYCLYSVVLTGFVYTGRPSGNRIRSN